LNESKTNRGAGGGEGGLVIQIAAGTRVYLACRPVDLRKGFDGLTAQVATVLQDDPFCGHLFVFRGKRGDYLKLLYWDGSGLCLFAKRLEKGRFTWPITKEGTITLTPAQTSMLLEGLEWRAPQKTWAPTVAG
jgi:transposase